MENVFPLFLCLDTIYSALEPQNVSSLAKIGVKISKSDFSWKSKNHKNEFEASNFYNPDG